MRDWLSIRSKQMNRYERLLYFFYKRSNGYALGKRGTGLHKEKNNGRVTAHKFSPRHELAPLYFDGLEEQDQRPDYS